MRYKVGDKVRIFDKERNKMRCPGEMEKWCGKVMTISQLCFPYGYFMKEDNKKFIWAEDKIAGKVREE